MIDDIKKFMSDTYHLFDVNGSDTEYPRSQGPPYVPNFDIEKPSDELQDTKLYHGGRQTLTSYATQAIKNAGLHEAVQRDNVISPDDHTLKPIPMKQNPEAPLDTMEYFVKDIKGHFIRDNAQGIEGEEESSMYADNYDAPVARMGYTDRNVMPKYRPVFSGSTTDVNPLNDPTSKAILESGTLSRYLEETNRKEELGDYLNPPVSPLHPFTRLNSIDDQYLANKTIFKSYNRTKTPIADVAWRKAFRHIFITRPECYLWYPNSKGGDICDQARNDEDFSSAYTRMPHLIKLLSPYYVSESIPTGYTDANWNFLLCNTVQGLNTGAFTMGIAENVAHSFEGYTVTPAGFVESRQGSTLELTFTDTKYLEVYEFNRLWMLYMYKRRKGVFSPPFNGYCKENSFVSIPTSDGKSGTNYVGRMSGPQYYMLHPYDRALEYCASLYDIVTDETGTKVLYWCKYYGIYPTSVSPTLSNDKNEPIIDMKTSVTFKYHYKLENSNKTLVEFNHDAGLTDHVGNLNKSITTSSLSFLLRNDYQDPVMPQYIGAAGMFTGSPYIVMGYTRPNPIDTNTTKIVTPNLRFMSLVDTKLDGKINLGIINDKIDQPTKNVIAY